MISIRRDFRGDHIPLQIEKIELDTEDELMDLFMDFKIDPEERQGYWPAGIYYLVYYIEENDPVTFYLLVPHYPLRYIDGIICAVHLLRPIKL